MDDLLVGDMKKQHLHPDDVALLPEGSGWLLVEFGGETKDESDDKARELMDALRRTPHPPSMKLYDDQNEEAQIWKVRESGLGATAHVPGEKITWEGWEDSAVPPEKLGDYLRDFRKLLEQARLWLRALRPLRPGLHPHPDRFRSADRRGHRKLPPLHRRSRGSRRRAMAARSPASTATASRERSCCRRCSGQS